VLQQGVAACPRGLTHAPHMTLEMPGGDELRHHRLAADVGMTHVQRAAAGERLGQRGRQHQVTQAQGGKGDLAEGADVEHPPLAIQRGQGRQRRAVVAIFAVVVVLDDPAIAALSPRQQLQAPRQRQRDAAGILVRRRHIGQPAAPESRQLGGVQTLAVHRDTTQLGTRHGEGMTGGAIAGIFHRHAITRLYQQLGAEADALLRTAGDHHLTGIAVQTTTAAQVGCHQFAQCRIAGRVTIAQACRRWTAPETSRKACPDIEGEQVERRHTDAEGTRCTRERRRQMMRLEPPQRLGGSRRALRRASLRPLPLQRRDIGTCAHPSLDITLGIQLVEGARHGIARDAQQRSQVSAGRQAGCRRPGGRRGCARATPDRAGAPVPAVDRGIYRTDRPEAVAA